MLVKEIITCKIIKCNGQALPEKQIKIFKKLNSIIHSFKIHRNWFVEIV